MVDTNDPVEPGETLEVDTTITNTGEEEGTQEIVLELNGDVLDTAEVTLGPGESETITLSGDTEGLEPGEYTATVSSDNDTAEVTVTIGDDEPIDDGLQVTIESTNAPVEPGDVLEVDALIENLSDEELTQDIVLELNGEVLDTAEVTLGPGDSDTITLSGDTEGLEPGEYTVTISSDDDSDSVTITIDDEPVEDGFEVIIEGVTEPIEVGDLLEVEALIENTSTETITQTIEVALNGEVLDSVEVTLEPGDSELVTLSVDTSDLEPGEYTVTVSSEDDSDSVTITIDPETEPGVVSVSITDTNAPVAPGDTLEVVTAVENTGDEAVTQDLTLTLNGTVLDSVTVELDPGESDTITLSTSTIGLEPGTYTITVSIGDVSGSVTITIEEEEEEEEEEPGETGDAIVEQNISQNNSNSQSATAVNGDVSQSQAVGQTNDASISNTTATTGSNTNVGDTDVDLSNLIEQFLDD
ncbi:hypothetical protein C482_16398 [Natrialba chahannaoensis JCM 10990]|uniref:CARDB domain-containing protein n=1 Tax=Natrialba chahannaoensis JCM 10990 TaxID=1227492 RepID=M0AD18_9EURY|nr:hypothetical protein [Natrialba chahannaoensis]ELY95243.1 hypothetical protein C482_16398 [Natrialba chahannaoensis JCM 10990]